jgi:hypothetical protein
LNERAVYIGACGWQYPQWNDSYYPEGLPQEWQLAYYGNEYPVVLIPASYWAQGRVAVAAWLEETESRPRFICECQFASGQQDQVAELELIGMLGERVDGILWRLSEMPADAQLETIGTLTATYAVCLDWPNADPAQLQTLLAHPQLERHVSICWHGDDQRISDLTQGPLALARVATAGQTPRSLRTLLETLVAHAGERQAVLLFDGQPPDLEIVDQAEVILNLL